MYSWTGGHYLERRIFSGEDIGNQLQHSWVKGLCINDVMQGGGGKVVTGQAKNSGVNINTPNVDKDWGDFSKN